jgi:hypothetical protein
LVNSVPFLEVFVEDSGNILDTAVLHPELNDPDVAALAPELARGLLRVFQNPLEGVSREPLTLQRRYTSQRRLSEILGPTIGSLFRPASGPEPNARRAS